VFCDDLPEDNRVLRDGCSPNGIEGTEPSTTEFFVGMLGSDE